MLDQSWVRRARRWFCVHETIDVMIVSSRIWLNLSAWGMTVDGSCATTNNVSRSGDEQNCIHLPNCSAMLHSVLGSPYPNANSSLVRGFNPIHFPRRVNHDEGNE